MDSTPRIETTALAAARALRRAFDARLAPLELNLSSASALSFLREAGPLSQTQLAELLHIGRASTGTLIDDLEAKRLVVRGADATDRRAWRIELTVAGVEKADAFDAIDKGLRSQFRRGMTRDERHVLADLLVRLESNAEAATAKPSVAKSRASRSSRA